MKINKIIVLNGGLDDFSYSVGQAEVTQIRELFDNGRHYFEVNFNDGRAVDIYAHNLLVFREVA